jgi:radical SAM superfamily enzyme YgiQ (UPF0313 family)
MRVALVSMPELSPFIQGESWHIPNLALCNVAGNTPGHDVRVYDLNRRRGNVRRAVEKILDEFQPDLLGMSSMTFQYDTARAIAWLAKRRRPGIVTVLGGYHASMLYREIGASWDAGLMDWLVRGEGDLAVAEILEVLEGKRAASRVQSASYRDGDRYVHNDDRPLQALDTLALPARHRRAYRGAHLGFRPADVMETSRGCTLACNFCSINTMYGKSHRFFPIDYVLQDLEQMVFPLGVASEVFCADDNITNDLDRLEELCDALIVQRRRIGKRFYLTTQATCAGIAQSQRLVDKMAQAGFVKVFLGIENVSGKTLRDIKKGDIVELTKTAVARLREARIICVGGCINGFPHDDIQCLTENFEFFKMLGIDHTIDQLITPYPGTPARELALEGGYVTNESDLRHYNGFWANVRTDYMSSDELQFNRWKLAREIIGPFMASDVYQEHYPLVGPLWNRAFRPVYKRVDRWVMKAFGERWRFERMMRAYHRRDEFNLEPPPEPFRVKTLPLEKRSFSMRGIQGWTSAEMSKRRHALPVVA